MINLSTKTLNVKDFLLEKVHYELGIRIDTGHLYYANVECAYKIIDSITNDALLQIRGFVWGENLKEPKYIRYPKDWVEAFKERWFPKFLLNRYPVKYSVYEISTAVLYPNYQPSISNKEWHMHHTVNLK
jgi:hypothetical protein